MTITINGESYNKASVHQLFKRGREAVSAHGIADNHGYISKALFCTEMFTHILGNLAEMSDFVESR